jgi:hypothetical protein
VSKKNSSKKGQNLLPFVVILICLAAVGLSIIGGLKEEVPAGEISPSGIQPPSVVEGFNCEWRTSVNGEPLIFSDTMSVPEMGLTFPVSMEVNGINFIYKFGEEPEIVTEGRFIADAITVIDFQAGERRIGVLALFVEHGKVYLSDCLFGQTLPSVPLPPQAPPPDGIRA